MIAFLLKQLTARFGQPYCCIILLPISLVLGLSAELPTRSGVCRGVWGHGLLTQSWVISARTCPWHTLRMVGLIVLKTQARLGQHWH